MKKKQQRNREMKKKQLAREMKKYQLEKQRRSSRETKYDVH